MSQNRSSAVMQQRSEPHHSLDDFPTPPWATRALCEYLQQAEFCLQNKSVREPAANRGHMVRPLSEYFEQVFPSDVHDYGAGYPVRDYLFGPPPEYTDWTITNPPFRLAEQFIKRAMTCSGMVAVLVRTAFLEGVGRHQNLFSAEPPLLVLQFVERVVMHKGRLAPKGSTATAYCWMVWSAKLKTDTEFDWIAPCRKRLERASDYEAIL